MAGYSRLGRLTQPAVAGTLAFIACIEGPLCLVSFAQTPSAAPSITAVTKGPDQINLTWPPAVPSGDGYLVEIQSDQDRRYGSFTELQPLPRANGYTCDPNVRHNGGVCTISDAAGVHVYNPSNNGLPYWVTERTYIDPQDSTRAQFIAWGLKPNTSYTFRVRSFSDGRSLRYGPYSSPSSATTAKYSLRYVAKSGRDSNDGTGPDASHAWLTLAHASSALACGQELIVMGGNYAKDGIYLKQSCTASNKVVVLVNPGDTATITSSWTGSGNMLALAGSHLVVDGVTVSSPPDKTGSDFDGEIFGDHDALLNVTFGPAVVPSFERSGVEMHGHHNLIYRSFLHDYGSPDDTQNPGGNGGFLLVMPGGSNNNVIWSNHLTRGGHDVSLCKNDCYANRWLNNIMDGGWGMAWNAVYVGAQNNLVEGNFIKDPGRLVNFYKPGVQVSQGPNTIRRNIVAGAKSWALEVSALYGGSTVTDSLIYNNTFYSPAGCYFQSHNQGTAAYNGVVYANNICYKLTGVATDIYLGNTSNRIVNNNFVYLDSAGMLQPNHGIIIWRHDEQGSYQYPVPLAQADTIYNPPFGHNKGLDVNPHFVDETNMDFHLSPGSPLLGAGVSLTDPLWGSPSGRLDLGAFGIAQISFQPAR